MSQTIQANPQARVESIARVLPAHAQEDFRALMNDIILANLTALSPGGNLIQPGGTPASASAPPTGVTHAVVGANAQYSVAISNPPGVRTPIYHELSYSPVVSFTKGVTTLPVTTNTSLQVPSPGGNYYFRLRSSFDKKTWSNYTLSSPTAIAAGLIGSDATAPAATFNQTNYAVVSPTVGGADAVTISGPNGQFTPYTAIKGSTQSLRPSATIVGTQFGPDVFVGWDGSRYQIKSTLAEVLADDLEPVGKVTIGTTENGGGGTTGSNGGRLTAVTS